MTAVFLNILDMSLTASWAIAVILAVRFLLRKMPRKYLCLLWLAVLFRLLCPVTVSGSFSLIPDFLADRQISGLELENEAVSMVPENAGEVKKSAEQQEAFSALEEQTENAFSKTERLSDLSRIDSAPAESEEPAATQVLRIGTAIWLCGILVLGFWNLFSYFHLRKRLRENRFPYDKNLWMVPGLETPFVTGIVRPQIYLPAELQKEEQPYILLHEQTHIRRRDPLMKLLGFAALCLHWFNPLVWLAFYLASADLEMACDEQVLAKLGSEVRQDYSSSLLRLASGRRLSSGLPLAFGEGNPKKRILHILGYKKPRFRVAAAACALIFAIAAGLLLNPGKAADIDPALTIEQLKADAVSGDWFEVDCPENEFRTRIYSNQLKQWLEETRFRAKKVNSPYELIYTYEVRGLGTEDSPVAMRLYEAEQELVMVYSGQAWQYYTIRNEDYNSFEMWLAVQSNWEPYEIVTPDEEEQEEEGKEAIQSVGEQLDALFAELTGQNLESGNPGSYIEAKQDAFDEIVNLGNSTLAYCFEAFEQGSQTDLKGSLMAEACRQITGEAEEDEFATSQEWYEAVKIRAKKMEAEQGWDNVAKYEPLEGALLRYLDGDMEAYSEEIQLPDYTYLGSDSVLRRLYETEQSRDTDSQEGFRVRAIRVHGNRKYEETDGDILKQKIFATVYTGNYRLLGKEVYDVGGSVIPVAVTYESRDGGESYTLLSYEQAKDGSYFVPSIEDFCTMPVSGEPIEGLASEIIRIYGEDPELRQLIEKNLQEHLERYGQGDVTIHHSGLPPAE